MVEKPTGSENHVPITPIAFSRAQTVSDRRFQFNPLLTVLTIILMLLGLVVWFMFSARVVTLMVAPEPERIAVTQGLPAYQLGDRWLMLPGEYQVQAEAPGYEPLSAAFTVTAEEEQAVSLTMQKLPGILTITSDPLAPATLLVDGVEAVETARPTPLVIDQIPAGEHLIVIQPERYLQQAQRITIEGMRLEQQLHFNLEPAWAMITVNSLPAGAGILVDGKPLGQTPATVEILKGVRQISLSLKGHKNWRNDISVVAGKDQDLGTIPLIKADGSLSLTTEPPGALVTISGQYHGQTPLTVKLKPGEYDMNLRKAGFATHSQSIEMKAEEDIDLDISLAPVLGQIRLQVQPAGAKLYVNNRLYGPVPPSIELTASRHQLRFEKEGYASQEKWVTPQPGLAQSLTLMLKTEKQAAFDAIPKSLRTSLGQELKLIVPGKLTLGAGRSEPGRRSNEVIREAQLRRLFYIGSKEVTNKAFKTFEPGHDSGMFGRSVLNQPDRPVVNITWDQVIAFCNWLSRQENLPEAYVQTDGQWVLSQPVGRGYRLPTETEWAWSARKAPGSGHPFPWGKDVTPPAGAGNFADESATGLFPGILSDYRDGFRGTAPVGSFAANGYGLYDMAGNVSEWMNDRYGVVPVTKAVADPLGPATGEYHVIRGSSFAHGTFSELRWAYRDFAQKPRHDLGFRLARYAE